MIIPTVKVPRNNSPPTPPEFYKAVCLWERLLLRRHRRVLSITSGYCFDEKRILRHSSSGWKFIDQLKWTDRVWQFDATVVNGRFLDATLVLPGVGAGWAALSLIPWLSNFTRSTESFAGDLELAPFTILRYVNEVVAFAFVDGKFGPLVFLGNLRV